MQAHHYPFIDLAVHSSVRDRFANGDAVAVLSPDLGEVLWANGAAANLLGFSSIYDVLDEGFEGQTATRRQIESALALLRRTGKPQTFMMRTNSGFSRSMAAAGLEDFMLPDGAPALLLTSSNAGKILAPGARARQIIAGFEGTGTHVAVLDKDGRVLAASSTFDAIGLAGSDIERMIADVANADDRLVKRMTDAYSGPMPTAIGRLADDPALHLLFAVEPATADETSAEAESFAAPEDVSEQVDLSDGSDAPVPADIARNDQPDEALPDMTPDLNATDEEDNQSTMEAGTDPVGQNELTGESALPGEPTDQPVRFDTSRVREDLTARLEKAEQSEHSAELEDIAQSSADTGGLESQELTDDHADDTPAAEVQDEQEETTGEDLADSKTAGETNPEAELPVTKATLDEPQFRFDPEGKPVRFVWKINQDGEFSEISPEFALAVGPHSADVIGRKFPDLARVFNLDPDHVITDLLNRRDTWSGKTVYWPIQGTDLVTPVDLAALPTYTRDRRFDGFRGFGIVRTGETRQDSEALGLALAPGMQPRSGPDTSAHAADDEAKTDETNLPDSAHLPETEHPIAEDDAFLEMQDLERDIEDLARMDGAMAETTDDQDNPAEFTTATSDETSDADETGTNGAPDTDSEDPFQGERPALHLVETPMRRDSDKVINLEARRVRPRESLSPGEQAAFREIGVRLNETTSRQAEADAAEEAKSSEVRKTFGNRQPPLTDDQPATDNGDQPVEPAAPSEDRPDANHAEADAAEHDERAHEETASVPASATRSETPAPTPMPSAFALPARQVMHTGMNAGFIDAIPVALLVQAGDALIHANSEFFDLTGYGSLDELAASGGLDHLLDRPSEDEPAIDGAMLVRQANGGTRMVTARLRSVNWHDGHALLLALSPIDADADAGIAEPASVELADQPEPCEPEQDNALKIEAQELRSILETATDGVVILDNDGTIRSMNRSACALFNYDETETHKQPFAMLFAHESQRAVMEYVSGLADHGVSSVLNDGREVIGREAAGGFLPLFMTIGRLSGSNGYCAVLRDITQWKRTEDELRAAKRAAETANSHKTDFLARVSHEIRTPLNAIIGFSEMMVEERFGPIGSPRYLEYAHDIGNSGKHVLDIVNDLLDISKIEAGQVQMEFVSVSLNDHLAESVSLLQPMANSQRVIIRTSLSTSVPEVVADRRSIKQIALNLLSNAIRYTPSGGQIVVSTSYEPSGNVVIRIRDTGIGMNRKELEQAMKPFGQVGPGPRQRGEGTGLGLPLTKAMVEANRAQFDIVSAPGEGTLVSIAFPPQRVLAD
ncbi:PAS domain S-box [Hoeflea sp. IMCC20628]|uniref:PAS domain-containing sensor histidine kinase n=1 Tax=Hoeflea sp. IMCC20628 TaxID=1620421 RepID=UPI00063ACCF6|nr:ATP-binding protein [Hoeflea sp. IMCC20628]AKI02076.1 PAS domain S-box [Hoeflea sp. IMCC20628]